MFFTNPLLHWPLLLLAAMAIIHTGFSHGSSLGWQTSFAMLFLFRYTRTLVSTWAFWLFRGRPLSLQPRLDAKSVSVVVPTKFSNPPEHIQCIRNILACGVNQVIVVTAHSVLPLVSKHLADAGISTDVTLLSVPKLDKRQQMVHALQTAVRSEIVCFADDDVQWPSAAFIPAMLACFEDPSVGAAGPKQRVTRQTSGGILPGFTGLCHFLGICYIERRNFNTAATQYMDGSLSTLSGRTSFYRASIIQNARFYDYFTNANNHDDDKNLTRWTFVHGWKIQLQFHADALIETSLENDYKGFFGQCNRWARGHWRGNFRVMSSTNYWWKTHSWSLYAIYIGQFQTPAIIFDGMLTWLLANASAGYRTSTDLSVRIFVAWVIFLCFTKSIKIMPHFYRHPTDLIHWPAMIMFSYFHGLINVWCLYTRNNKAWGKTGGAAANKSAAAH